MQPPPYNRLRRDIRALFTRNLNLVNNIRPLLLRNTCARRKMRRYMRPLTTKTLGLRRVVISSPSGRDRRFQERDQDRCAVQARVHAVAAPSSLSAVL